MAAFGLTPDDMLVEVEIWPDFVASVNLFYSLRTQWRMGAAGAIGLDYNVLYMKMDRMNLTQEQYEQLEYDIRVLEIAALKEINKKD